MLITCTNRGAYWKIEGRQRPSPLGAGKNLPVGPGSSLEEGLGAGIGECGLRPKLGKGPIRLSTLIEPPDESTLQVVDYRLPRRALVAGPHDQKAYRAVTHRVLVLGPKGGEVGPFCRGQGRRASKKHQHNLAASIDGAVIVVSPLERGDAETRKHHRGSHLLLLARQVRERHIVRP